MKKTYDASNKARSPVSFHKHLRLEGKRRVNKSSRRLGREQIRDILTHPSEI